MRRHRKTLTYLLLLTYFILIGYRQCGELRRLIRSTRVPVGLFTAELADSSPCDVNVRIGLQLHVFRTLV